MTWSIIARDGTGAFGIAIASRFLAVGALCPYARSRVGAVATQALVNPHYGPAGLDAMAAGETPAAAIARLTAADAGRDHRQVHMIDRAGRTAVHTGSACIPWCGHLSGFGWSVAGNMLAGPQVVERSAEAYCADPDQPFALRLIRALHAGEAAGGDKRGRQGAALLIYTTEQYPALDLRVDDHEWPLVELHRLYERSLDRYQPFISCLPTAVNPAGITDRALIEEEIARFQAIRAAWAR